MIQQLVKVYFLLFCFVLCNKQAQGQDLTTESLKKQKESVVYFASGSAELNAKALETLKGILQQQVQLESAQFRLQAFTDDVGSPERNALLAKSRATQVQDYLSQQGIAIQAIKIQAFQQLHLNLDKDVAKQRANNRRVVVELWGLALEKDEELKNENALSIEKFFNRNPKEYQQNFTFSAAKGKVIEGEKGTVLQIPANCFVDSKGNVVNGEISFLLQEAYSYSDMLFQNLSTVSDGQLLETGGMLFIEAKDTAGNVLKIREGAEIIAAMASDAAKSPEMQTFEGVVDSTDNSVNWVATNQQVLSDNQSYQNLWTQGMSNRQSGLYQRSPLGMSFTGLKEIPTWELKLPKEVDKPRFSKRVPKYPRLKETVKPSKDALIAKVPQRTHESNVDYNKKIRKKYALLQASYRKKVQSNRNKKMTYKRDSSHYERALAKHEKNVLKYGLYNEEMRLVLEEMYDNMTNFELNLYQEEYYKLQKFAGQFRQRNALMSGGKLFIENILDSKAAYDSIAQELRLKLSTIDLASFTDEECALIETCWSKKLGKKLSSYSFRVEYNKSRFRIHRYRVANIYNRVTETGNLKSYRLRQIRNMKKLVKDHYTYKGLHKIDQEVQGTQKKALPLITQFLNKETTAIELHKEFLEVKTELNILTPSDVVDVYSNAMRIRNAGWINCDRIMNGINTIDLEVITEYTENTRVLVLFEGAMKSLMTGSVTSQRSFKFDGIPGNRAVKLIGFRVVGDSMEVFIEEGTVRSLNGVKPTFKKKTVEEVESMMMAI